jgi:hypothetical protein
MRADAVKLLMPDGTTKVIRATIAKDIRLCDRAVVRLRSVIKGIPIKPRRIDGELAALLACVNVEESDGTFAEAKRFATILDKIQQHFSEGSLQTGSPYKQ